MFRNILVATDLSAASERVLACLKGLRGVGAETATIVYALGLGKFEDMKEELSSMAEPALAAQKKILESYGLKAQYVIAPGRPSLEIKRIADEIHASIVVVGSHGQSLSDDIALGSVAAETLQTGVKPILLIRVRVSEGEPETQCSDLTGHILHPTDFSDTAERAFLYLEELVENGARRVTLIHVQDKSRIARHLEERLEEFNLIDNERLERLKSRLLEKGATDVAISIPYGLPTQEILSCAKDEKPSLIVMGSQGRSFISELFVGSVSYNVARHAEIPLLLIPAIR